MIILTRRDIEQRDGTIETTRETSFAYSNNVRFWTRQDFVDAWEEYKKDMPNYFKKK